jgi:hypothetical protein
LQLSQLAAEADSSGWSSTEGTIWELRHQARLAGWSEVPIRQGEAAVTTLKPTTQEEARPRSMSASVGMGQQPLHTDGAHLTQPPDYVALVGESTSETPTLVWKFVMPAHLSESFHHGMFAVNTGRSGFIELAVRGSGLRFDPEVMRPLDGMAKRVRDYLLEASSQAKRFEWDRPGLLLLISNRYALHARASVAPGDESRALERVAFRIGARR